MERLTKRTPEVHDVELTTPEPADFLALRESVGWGVPRIEVARSAIDNSLICACAKVGNELVGFGRVVGDAAMYYYIQDVVVRPDFQKRGIGGAIVAKLLEWIRHVAPPEAHVALSAESGLAGFYEQFGFKLTGDAFMMLR